jgi:lysozyme family protein
MAVNMGVRQATILCQRAVNACTSSRVIDDGVIGAKTLSAINACNPEALMGHLREASAGFYRHIASVRPEAAQYLRGWLARAEA